MGVIMKSFFCECSRYFESCTAIKIRSSEIAEIRGRAD